MKIVREPFKELRRNSEYSKFNNFMKLSVEAQIFCYRKGTLKSLNSHGGDLVCSAALCYHQPLAITSFAGEYGTILFQANHTAERSGVTE